MNIKNTFRIFSVICLINMMALTSCNSVQKEEFTQTILQQDTEVIPQQNAEVVLKIAETVHNRVTTDGQYTLTIDSTTYEFTVDVVDAGECQVLFMNEEDSSMNRNWVDLQKGEKIFSLANNPSQSHLASSGDQIESIKEI